ncbi:MAG: S41 family peptidase [Acidobacteriota bacterium]
MKQKTLFWSVFFVLAGSLLGGVSEHRTAATTDQVTEDSLRTFTEILSLIEHRYMEEVEPDELIYSAIRGILKDLDPHSNFLDPAAYGAMREEQRGRFSGLGIVISKPSVEEPITVISPIQGTPADRAGIRAGDVISHIEGVETLGMTADQAVHRLKGPKGTPVTITVSRPGTEDPLSFTIVRDDISTVSIQHAYLIRPSVGYIKINNFTRTTHRELQTKLQELRAQGMQNLLLDLRGNPGGLLDQAVKVSEQFLEKGNLIVYTRGRISGSDQEFRAKARNPEGDLPLIVLVDRSSASASEIVAGAIQDHDRGLILGKSTWGKGLVQTVYPLNLESALALTTARYFTPSGRLIQRDYASFEEYLSGRVPDPPTDEREVRLTDGGREVFGGGGITPDIEVDLQELSPFINRMDRQTFFQFAVQYNSGNRNISADSFRITDEILEEFRQFLISREAPATTEEIQENSEYLRVSIKQEIFNGIWGMQAGYKVYAESDLQIQTALGHFEDARELAQLAARREAQLRDGVNFR